MSAPKLTEAVRVTIAPVDGLNPDCGYQIRVERDGETILFTANDPVTGASLDYVACLDVARMYADAGRAALKEGGK